jgi:hypothetical protein
MIKLPDPPTRSGSEAFTGAIRRIEIGILMLEYYQVHQSLLHFGLWIRTRQVGRTIEDVRDTTLKRLKESNSSLGRGEI